LLVETSQADLELSPNVVVQRISLVTEFSAEYQEQFYIARVIYDIPEMSQSMSVTRSTIELDDSRIR
jgi:hypothetical protein